MFAVEDESINFPKGSYSFDTDGGTIGATSLYTPIDLVVFAIMDLVGSLLGGEPNA